MSVSELPMKVLVFGARGWIGGQVGSLLDAMDRVTWVSAEGIRADDLGAVSKLLDDEKPTHVLSLIGRTHGGGINTIDYLELPGKLPENVRDNLMAPLQLALSCSQRGIHYTYLGTGCIFSHPDDPAAQPYTEESLPDFFGSSYSIVKGFTDRLMHALDSQVLNVRIRMPITADLHPRNFITKITSYKKVCSIENSMTVLPELLPLMVDMMRKGVTGTVNLTNPGVISHNEILEMYKECVDPTFTWQNFTMEEQDSILTSKRSNNMLCTRKLQAMYPHVKDIRTAVRECILGIAAGVKS